MNKSAYEKLLLRSFDEDLSKNELRLLEAALARDASLREYKESLMRLRQNLGEYETAFSAGFEDRVVNRLKLRRLLAPPYLTKVFRRTGMLAAAAILVLLILIYWHEQSLDVNSLLGLSDLQPEDFDHLFANY